MVLGELKSVAAVAAQLMALQALTSWGLQWPSAAVLPANMKNFPAHQEPVNAICVVALLKCIGSVGGGLSVQLYLAFIAPDQTGCAQQKNR